MPLHIILPSHPQLRLSSLIRHKQLYIHALVRGCQYPQTSLSVFLKSRRWVQVSNSDIIMSENGVKCTHCGAELKCTQLLLLVRPKSTNSILQDHHHSQKASPQMSGHQSSRRQIQLREFQIMWCRQLWPLTRLFKLRWNSRLTGATAYKILFAESRQLVFLASCRILLCDFCTFAERDSGHATEALSSLSRSSWSANKKFVH